jgi:transcriptional regulatory protein LevR
MKTKKINHEELLKDLKVVQYSLSDLSKKVEDLIYLHELPYLLARIEKLQKSKKIKKITTAWLQKEFQIGYAKAAKLKSIVDNQIE